MTCVTTQTTLQSMQSEQQQIGNQERRMECYWAEGLPVGKHSCFKVLVRPQEQGVVISTLSGHGDGVALCVWLIVCLLTLLVVFCFVWLGHDRGEVVISSCT